MQRLLSFTGAGRMHADGHQAVLGHAEKASLMGLKQMGRALSTAIYDRDVTHTIK